MTDPQVLGTATAFPDHLITQSEAKDAARELFGDDSPRTERLLGVFDRAGVHERRLCVPLDWFARSHDLGETNDRYLTEALTLGAQAATRALDRAGREPAEVDAVTFVSSSGLATPSLDARLVGALGLRPDVRRDATYGHGCAGGVGGLARVADQVRARPDRVVVLVVVELCSLMFRFGDRTSTNLVAASLFADGAAAVVLGAGDDDPGRGPRLIGDGTTLWPDTAEVMGADLTADGMRLVLSRSVPKVVRDRFAASLDEACERNGLSRSELTHLVLHPGGAGVIDAYRGALDVDDERLVWSIEVLRRHGNVSAPTALIALDAFCRCRPDRPAGELGVISAMGPGFAAEHVLFTT